MRRAVRSLLVLGSLMIVGEPGMVSAHVGGEPFIHVPAGFVTPGGPFHLVAADLGSDSTVTIELQTDDGTLPIGTVVAGSDGHFEADFALPAAAPTGYRQLVARADDGTMAATWVMVTTADPAVPAGLAASRPIVDPSLLILLALVAGGIAIWVIRRRMMASR
jgi:hypothetical protein